MVTVSLIPRIWLHSANGLLHSHWVSTIQQNGITSPSSSMPQARSEVRESRTKPQTGYMVPVNIQKQYWADGQQPRQLLPPIHDSPHRVANSTLSIPTSGCIPLPPSI